MKELHEIFRECEKQIIKINEIIDNFPLIDEKS